MQLPNMQLSDTVCIRICVLKQSIVITFKRLSASSDTESEFEVCLFDDLRKNIWYHTILYSLFPNHQIRQNGLSAW